MAAAKVMPLRLPRLTTSSGRFAAAEACAALGLAAGLAAAEADAAAEGLADAGAAEAGALLGAAGLEAGEPAGALPQAASRLTATPPARPYRKRRRVKLSP